MQSEPLHDVVGWTCVVCGSGVALTTPDPWRCPNSTRTDRHHVLRSVAAATNPARVDAGAVDGVSSAHPFIAYDRRLAWAAAAAARGLSFDDRSALVDELDAAVTGVDGVGFAVTPLQRSDALSDALGFAPEGGVWVKDETHGVGGSQKARHLFSILLHLRALEVTGQVTERAPLAIASCGNAALAAATLAKAAGWPIDVFVPTWMSSGFGDRLDELDARVHRCERRASDPPGDPAMHRFRDAVEAGAIPFTVQGPENGVCLDGGRTLGWEIVDQLDAAGIREGVSGVFVQVGGGAFATCVGSALADAAEPAPLFAVQAAGCAPFDRAWRSAAEVASRGAHWGELMIPWDDPHSLADGILDDETYDWLGVADAVERTGGSSVVAAEERIVKAHVVAHEAGFDASPTGTAGLAGLLEVGVREGGAVHPASRVVVVMSGVERPGS